MDTKIASFIFFLFIICGCNSKQPITENIVKGTWRLYDISSLKETPVDFATSAVLKSEVKEGALINLFEDNSYAEIKGSGSLKLGKWNFNNEKFITLTGEGSGINEVSITEEKNVKGKTNYFLNIERGSLLYKFLKESTPLEHYKDDPFYISNNQWRTKPAKEENRKEMNRRLADYFKHLALILKASKERKQDIVSFEFSKGPVKIYNRGIGIYPFDIVPKEWKNYFYNDVDALTAYTLFNNYLRTNRYKGAAVGDWVEDDYNILLSIYADFDKEAQ